MPIALSGLVLNLKALMVDNATHTALLTSHGRADDMVGVEAFQTPMELALEAKFGEQLRPGATATELFDAYVGTSASRRHPLTGFAVSPSRWTASSVAPYHRRDPGPSTKT